MERPVKSECTDGWDDQRIALDLMERIFIEEGKSVHTFADCTTREDILQTYVECLRVVRTGQYQK